MTLIHLTSGTMEQGMNIATLGSLLLLAHSLVAQSQEKVIQGIVKDQQTLQVVPAVHVVTSRQGTFSDRKGAFSLVATPSDTITLSHVNYQSYYLPTDAIKDTLLIFLHPRDLLLQEVVVRGLPTEEQFRNELLRISLAPNREEMHAIANVAYAQQLYLSGYVPSMNSQDNYQWQLRQPHGITLFSSGPTKGLLKAIKNLSRRQRLSIPQRTNSIRFISDGNHLNKKTGTELLKP